MELRDAANPCPWALDFGPRLCSQTLGLSTNGVKANHHTPLGFRLVQVRGDEGWCAIRCVCHGLKNVFQGVNTRSATELQSMLCETGLQWRAKFGVPLSMTSLHKIGRHLKMAIRLHTKTADGWVNFTIGARSDVQMELELRCSWLSEAVGHVDLLVPAVHMSSHLHWAKERPIVGKVLLGGPVAQEVIDRLRREQQAELLKRRTRTVFATAAVEDKVSPIQPFCQREQHVQGLAQRFWRRNEAEENPRQTRPQQLWRMLRQVILPTIALKQAAERRQRFDPNTLSTGLKRMAQSWKRRASFRIRQLKVYRLDTLPSTADLDSTTSRC